MIANRIRRIVSTATPVPARAHGGPNVVGIEFDDAIDALVLATANPLTEATSFVFPATFTESVLLPGTTAATADNYATFYVAPYPVEVVSVKSRHENPGTSSTVIVKKVPSGTAKASGTDVLASAMSTAGTADTNVSGTLHATAANYRLAAGDALALVSGGTLTNLDGLTVTVELKRRTV